MRTMVAQNKKLKLVEPIEAPVVDPIEGYEPLFLASVQLLDQYWASTAIALKPVVEKAMHGEMTLDDIYEGIKAGRMYCLVGKNDDGEVPDVIIAFVFELITYPQYTLMNITAMGGREMKLLGTKFWKHVCSWAYMNGVRQFQAYTSSAMARMLRRYGFNEVYSVMRLDLTEM